MSRSIKQHKVLAEGQYRAKTVKTKKRKALDRKVPKNQLLAELDGYYDNNRSTRIEDRDDYNS